MCRSRLAAGAQHLLPPPPAGADAQPEVLGSKLCISGAAACCARKLATCLRYPWHTQRVECLDWCIAPTLVQ